jgi:hypothetical protein
MDMPPPLLVGFAALRRTCGSDTLQGYRTPKRHEASKGDSFHEKVQEWLLVGQVEFWGVQQCTTCSHRGAARNILERLQNISWVLSGSKLQAYP